MLISNHVGNQNTCNRLSCLSNWGSSNLWNGFLEFPLDLCLVLCIKPVMKNPCIQPFNLLFGLLSALFAQLPQMTMPRSDCCACLLGKGEMWLMRKIRDFHFVCHTMLLSIHSFRQKPGELTQQKSQACRPLPSTARYFQASLNSTSCTGT